MVNIVNYEIRILESKFLKWAGNPENIEYMEVFFEGFYKFKVRLGLDVKDNESALDTIEEYDMAFAGDIAEFLIQYIE